MTGYIPALLLITPSLFSLVTVTAVRDHHIKATRIYCRKCIAMSSNFSLLSISTIVALTSHPVSSLPAEIAYSILQATATGLFLASSTFSTTRTGTFSLFNILYGKAYYIVSVATSATIILFPTLFTLVRSNCYRVLLLTTHFILKLPLVCAVSTTPSVCPLPPPRNVLYSLRYSANKHATSSKPEGWYTL